jgi:CRISPR system Cascade subunit CasE
MYLTRGFLNPASRLVRADLADAASLHRTVMRAFPEQAGASPRKQHGVLHRVDEDPRRGRFVLFVQSAVAPDFTRVEPGYFLDLGGEQQLDFPGPIENPAVRAVDDERARLSAGERFAFRLKANTTKKIPKLDPAGARTKNGTRVPVKGDDARLAWLSRHAKGAGFRVEEVRISEVRPHSAGRARGLTFAGAVFEGILVVAEADEFREALAGGIGPGKAFGFGLLSVQRAR